MPENPTRPTETKVKHNTSINDSSEPRQELEELDEEKLSEIVGGNTGVMVSW